MAYLEKKSEAGKLMEETGESSITVRELTELIELLNEYNESMSEVMQFYSIFINGNARTIPSTSSIPPF
ncbi:hypothetical protein [Metallosphaera javensis (ex Sakai et al. 2022)]|uniref:hypothetical protein n=1 Tax=Metallosphaera javensis (ex Sakai et al. 2022) TaxID=2775498 RepID=UPI00258C3A45|nr:MAG: hypothetical protein MjAS7_0127 [Metallosphaera javensis (ex Sakai et al. 2022)]